MTDLVLLRHGQTDWNRTHRIQGQSQSQLDDLGRAQAAAVAPAIAALAPVLLWCSDADRARSTAEPIARETGLVPAYDARLREYHFGAREGLFHHEFEAQDPLEYAEFRRANWDAVTGVERQADVASRMTEVLSELADAVDAIGGATAPSGGRVGVAVSHGAAIRTATIALLGWPPEQALAMRGLANCGWVHLRRESGVAWRLVAYNRVAPDAGPRVPDTAV